MHKNEPVKCYGFTDSALHYQTMAELPSMSVLSKSRVKSRKIDSTSKFKHT